VPAATDGHCVGRHSEDGDEPARSTRTERVRVWSTVAVLTIAFGGFAYAHRETAAPSLAAPQPNMLFGQRGTDQRIPSDYPGGTGTACNEEQYSAGTGVWTCVSWAVNIRNLPIVEPPAYVGPCTHLLADQEHARWICLGGAPLPPQQLPPPVPGLYA
jgi:hypothetical protein